MANVLYKFPANSMIVIGVTGTDGKTTTAHMIYHLLSTEGKNVSLISTIAAIINGKQHDTGFHVTTPDSFTIQKYLSLAKKAGSEYVVIEVTSHAIDQNRVFGIPFAVSVLTNITPEHLDYHKTYENYLHTKFKLLHRAKTAVLNRDDTSYSYHSEIEKERSKTQYVTYGFSEKSEVNLITAPFVKKLQGEYNWSNGLAAVSVGKLLGLSMHEMNVSFSSFTFPTGRLETVYDKDFKVVIDFAHTAGGIEALLKNFAIKEKNGRLIHVFGSAGQRDVIKRPEMGKVSSRYADIIVLTAEDPRTEAVSDISAQIKDGIHSKNDHPVVITIDSREDAIVSAIEMAEKGDVVLITGKGHEKSMNMGHGEVPWSDHDAVSRALKKKYAKNT